MPVILIGIKRARERAQELHAALKIRHKITRKPNLKRNREGLEQELRDLDDPTFTRMFRMHKLAFFQLSDRCASHIKRNTPKSIRMARLSSGSDVTSMILLAATIRWLAGGSLWDIAFMFKMSCKTIHSYKYKVIYAINRTLRGNILFPRTDSGLQTLAKGFAEIGSGMGKAIPGVVAAVDSVCLQMKAPCARKSTNGTFETSIGQAFNRYSQVHVHACILLLLYYYRCYPFTPPAPTLFSLGKVTLPQPCWRLLMPTFVFCPCLSLAIRLPTIVLCFQLRSLAK